MSFENNIRAILECNFSGFKDEIIDIACNRIRELQINMLREIKEEIFDSLHYQSEDNLKFVADMVDINQIIENRINNLKGEEDEEHLNNCTNSY